MLSSDIWKKSSSASRKTDQVFQHSGKGSGTRLQLLRLFGYQHRLLVDALQLNGLILCCVGLTVVALFGLGLEGPAWLFYLPAILLGLMALILTRFGLRFKGYLSSCDSIARSLEREDSGLADKEDGVSKKELQAAFKRQGGVLRWDCRPCVSCGRSLGMMATACHYCGFRQKAPLHN